MEKIVFKTSKDSSIEKFIEWIERFKGEISKDSLIIEIDPLNSMFISKTYAQDRSLVRFSQISFKDAGLEVTKFNEELDKSRRILVGIFQILPRFITALKTFETAGSFSVEIDYDNMMVKNMTGEQQCAKSIQLKAKKLKMKIPGSSLNATETAPMDDDTFNNKVWVAPNPISVQLSGELLKNLVCISDIFASNEKLKNYMEFYPTSNEEGVKILKVRDPEQESYDYELGVVEGEGNDIVIPVYRDRFLLAVKNAFEDTKIILSSSNPNRVLIQLGEGDTKTIIARVNR